MTENKEEGLLDKAKGRLKKAAGDLSGDRDLRREGGEDEVRGQKKEELDEAQRDAEEKAREVERREDSGS